ncbi:MAG: DEAD/DEAH box helicase [Atopobiaceae bacterium]|nr:DEAD/DEAH box helicase [Atopobiaceae bacterium]
MTTTFAELGLNEQILAGVDALGFTQPTPVQEQAIPLVLQGRDLVASAQTGTGKTAAFTLPALQLIMGKQGKAAKGDNVSAAQDAGETLISPEEAATEVETTPPRKRRRRRRKKSNDQPQAQPAGGPARPLALVVTPTRELAQQIERVTTTVCQHTGQRCVIVMGGARFDRQLKQLAQGCDLLVATPGRLIDLMEHKHVDLGQVRILVLDEADRMLDMGFWPSVRRIVQALPAKRQNLLFSATIPPSIKGTVDAMLHDPATVEISRVGETADTVEEHLCPVTQGQKTQLLQAIVATGGAEPGAQLERVLVFCRTKHRVDDVSKTLKDAGLKVEVMHADRPQRARDKALERFRDGKVQVLVATDVMSRGIDVSGIDAVVNYDVPMDPEDYVHRIGRTGRAGATGHAYTFVAPDEISPLREIEYFTKKLIPLWDLEGFAYDEGRIVPNSSRSTTKPTRTMFSGSKSRRGFGGPSSGRFGRHY